MPPSPPEIPSYQQLMLPVLQVLDESGPLHTDDCALKVATRLGLSEAQIEEELPSGHSFNANATSYVEGLHQKVILIDGARLEELMIEHGIGVSTHRVYRVSKLDSDYFAT